MIQFPKPTVEQFFRTYVITNFTVSNDEKRLVFSSNLNGKMNLWAMDLPDTFPYQFAQHDESCSFIKFDPGNRHVLAGFDKDGDENHHIYAIPSEGGLPQPLISGGAAEKYFFAHLSEDGKRVYYMTSEENPSFLNARVRNLENNTDTLVNIGEVSPTELAAVSKNEDAFVYLRAFANTFVTGFVKTGKEQHSLTPDPEKVHVTFDPVFVDEKTIYFVTNYDSEYSYVAEFELETKEFSSLISIENESVESLKFNKENNALYLVTENGVTDELYRYDLSVKSLTKLSAPVDVIEQIHVAKSGNMYVLGRSATVPHNIFKSEDGKGWEQLTNNRVLGLDNDDMVEPKVVSYKSFDGMEIEALLLKAKPENDNGYTIFWPHGGPQASERKSFRSMFQCFLNRGYTIFAPNFRGSTGYGSSFVKLVEQDWGEGPRLDCVAGIEWLFEKTITDREKLFLVGGSYGGYMTLLLHGRHPEYFKACVDIFGPSDLFSFINSVPPHWKPIMDRWLGDPERDKERFIKDSPVTYLDGMTKPMLVIQGAKDPRVVKEESDNIVAKLEEAGRDVEYLVLEDEGHGFSKKENEINVYNRMLDFLEKHKL
ncbi:Dipeptidyl aminopeptidase/acylaminoacyl peptidase [Virgibacillus subterraneus]|uniref:Dipeptidyl aminopeptidase/acylaminoacyl peptidase n=1 Tax=Virgibacillus subterraneus TaxID=621109 RepID=A0A1H9I704_9BACI|nr:S9 family peptidase [Virgibacillus subterraneus]SEQ70360.1 Dipeptidyl aminopeptidase/acylaminoacyl peptidase [Virgibacillus subterraneus]